MQRTKPPFRADMVGSLLRPSRIKDARARIEKRAIADAELRRVEDMEIEKVIHKQKQIGLQSATDGEFRRSWWHFDFLKNLNGCEIYKTEGIEFNGMKTRGENIRVAGKIHGECELSVEQEVKRIDSRALHRHRKAAGGDRRWPIRQPPVTS